MQYGYFDDERREYVIKHPDTPLPWMNYLGCEDYFGIISNTGGGYSFYRDARLRRLTRYRYNNVPLDYGGRYIYVRDRRSGLFWSPSWQPTRHAAEEYVCRHGLGYSRIGSSYEGIRADILYFVPLGENLEVWDVEVVNRRADVAELSLFGTVEFCLWDAWDDATNFQRNYNTGEVEVIEDVIYHKTEYRERRNHFAYFACSEKLAGFETQRENFLGPYRGWENPLAVERGQCGNSLAHGWSPVGIEQVNLTLAPGERKRVRFILGYFENPNGDKFDPPGSQQLNRHFVRSVIERYRQEAIVDDAFEALQRYWVQLLGRLQVQTPNLHVNRMVNIWNVYQCMVTFNLSRSASGYESGIGRGLGFRDSNQDLLAFVHFEPERAKARLLDIAATQMEDGGAYHQYQPLTKRGNHDIGSNFNDDPLWLILAVAAYLKETGDWTICDELVTFNNQAGSEQPLYEHLRRSLRYTLERLGPHGLPLIGRADWNDCLNLNCFSEQPGQSFQTTTNNDGQVAESVFIAGLFVLAAQELAGIAERIGHCDEAEHYRAEAKRMKTAIDVDGWDGDWFLRAYDAFGQKIGSFSNEEGKIFIEPQGMCVMAGVGLDDGKAQRALESVERHLATPHGLVLLEPPYSHYYLNLGEISSYPPGYKENGGIFCHNNPWVMIAEAKAGNGDRALDYYLRINPSAREMLSEIHRCEPYCYAQMIAGRSAPTHGEAKNSWLTGTASWNYVAITQWILGIRPGFDGLEINPVIPSDWREFCVERVYRGVRYEIVVRRKGTGNQVKLFADGQFVPGRVLPLPPQGVQQVRVEVCLGLECEE
jgi:cellobiose phosphorylase